LQGLDNWRTVLHIGYVRFTEVKVLPFGAGRFDSAGPLLFSSFRRLSTTELVKPESSVLPFTREVQSFHSPYGRAGNFSLLVQRKVTKRNTPQVARSPGILPSDFASGFRGSLSAHPCARSALARIVRATLRALPPPARRATGAPFGRHPAAEAVARGLCSRAKFLCPRTIATTQRRDARIRA